MNFVKSNSIFFIWLSLYALVFASLARNDIEVFYALLGLELASLLIAISPIGEWLLRTLSGARKIKTSRDKEYVMPLFNCVNEDALLLDGKISKKITLYIEETKEVNACAFGMNSISVTRGAIESLDEDELKGVIAHELGHIRNGDTFISLVMTIGNGAFTLLWLILKFAMTRGKNKEHLKLVFMFNAMISFVVTAFTAIGSRTSEYMADKFAFDIGHGQGLLETLYFFKDLSMGEKPTLADKLKSTHPNLDNRIEQLENMGGQVLPKKQLVSAPKANNKPVSNAVRNRNTAPTVVRKVSNNHQTKESSIDTQIARLEDEIIKGILYNGNFAKNLDLIFTDELLLNTAEIFQEIDALKERKNTLETVDEEGAIKTATLDENKVNTLLHW